MKEGDNQRESCCEDKQHVGRDNEKEKKVLMS